MVAALYLIRDVHESVPQGYIRLFEGFVSYKDDQPKSDHRLDVELLREVVRDPGRFAGSIHEPDALRASNTDRLKSALEIIGVNCGVPVVLKRLVSNTRFSRTS